MMREKIKTVKKVRGCNFTLINAEYSTPIFMPCVDIWSFNNSADIGQKGSQAS